ncbi:MAG: preprotein translocase subunit SecG [Alphaproteobacteria bacterium]|nr:preprotein translocase subunit SecG [Alphaproteobacteria bacterium]
MSSVLLAIDIILAVFLTILVLLQRSEGGALGALGGGSGNSLFTGRQAGNMLTRLTWWTFVLFIVANLGLVILAKQATVAESIQLVPTEANTSLGSDVIADAIDGNQTTEDEQKPVE